MADPQILIPQIADEDFEWICGVMGLREFDQPRQDFLRARNMLDVSACPGSGKTTLIVAKLAIMARKWPHRTKGICVLSHTNTAREEIQRRLRGTGIGQQLLSYPHFVDTIHGFVNQFLALPWLNSNGFPTATVDDDMASGFRRRFLSTKYSKVDYYLKKQHSAFDNIRLADRNFQIKLSDNGRDRPFPAGTASEAYRLARSAVEQSSKAGYFCYDEMFIWARALLEDFPSVATLLQHRFPLVIIDEMQDTSDLQVGILDDVFPRSTSDVVLQRVGDPNQAVFQRPQHGSAVPGQFPDPGSCMTIPNSFRFGPAIATLASPFAVHAVGRNGLQGVGPRTIEDAPTHCQNALFIFPNAEPQGVLDAYAKHVLTSFGDETLAIGDVTAVGAVHQDASDVTASNPHFPKTVPHYWSRYTKEVGRNEPHPSTLIQYVRVAQALARNGHDHAPGVEKIASGIVRLARRSGNAERLGRRAPRHRTLVEAISPNAEATSAYRRLLKAFLVDSEALSVASWAQRQADILLVAAALGDPGTVPNSADSFLGWDQQDPSPGVPASAPPQEAGPNVYRFDDGAGRSVDIRLGSVHSVKGQTHLATMLLSTYWHDHSAKRLLPWLMGEKINLNGAGGQDRARLHQTYVAMTRPSHLICLAVPRSALGDDAVLTSRVARMIGRGWHVADVVDGAPSWHS
jgi:DNA helicase-2/ATP-dependent DNA helicase PcrA